MFALIIWDRFPRQWVTLGSGALVLVLVFGLCMHEDVYKRQAWGIS